MVSKAKVKVKVHGHGPGRRFVKGQSGNPHGRPRLDVCVTTWLKQYADIKLSTVIDPKTLTYAQAAALQAWRAAAKGELDSYNFIIDRIEGKVIQKIATDITTKGKALNDNRDISPNVIDEAMEILYRSGSDTLPNGEDSTAQT